MHAVLRKVAEGPPVVRRGQWRPSVALMAAAAVVVGGSAPGTERGESCGERMELSSDDGRRGGAAASPAAFAAASAAGPPGEPAEPDPPLPAAKRYKAWRKSAYPPRIVETFDGLDVEVADSVVRIFSPSGTAGKVRFFTHSEPFVRSVRFYAGAALSASVTAAHLMLFAHMARSHGRMDADDISWHWSSVAQPLIRWLTPGVSDNVMQRLAENWRAGSAVSKSLLPGQASREEAAAKDARLLCRFIKEGLLPAAPPQASLAARDRDSSPSVDAAASYARLLASLAEDHRSDPGLLTYLRLANLNYPPEDFWRTQLERHQRQESTASAGSAKERILPFECDAERLVHVGVFVDAVKYLTRCDVGCRPLKEKIDGSTQSPLSRPHCISFGPNVRLSTQRAIVGIGSDIVSNGAAYVHRGSWLLDNRWADVERRFVAAEPLADGDRQALRIAWEASMFAAAHYRLRSPQGSQTLPQWDGAHCAAEASLQVSPLPGAAEASRAAGRRRSGTADSAAGVDTPAFAVVAGAGGAVAAASSMAARDKPAGSFSQQEAPVQEAPVLSPWLGRPGVADLHGPQTAPPLPRSPLPRPPLSPECTPVDLQVAPRAGSELAAGEAPPWRSSQRRFRRRAGRAGVFKMYFPRSDGVRRKVQIACGSLQAQTGAGSGFLRRSGDPGGDADPPERSDFPAPCQALPIRPLPVRPLPIRPLPIRPLPVHQAPRRPLPIRPVPIWPAAGLPSLSLPVPCLPWGGIAHSWQGWTDTRVRASGDVSRGFAPFQKTAPTAVVYDPTFGTTYEVAADGPTRLL